MVLLCHVLLTYAIEPNNDAKRVQTESDAHIIGDVTDKTTGDHLGFITIAIKGTTIGTTTDATGHYFLKNLPEGKFTLIASSVGYKSISKEVEIKANSTQEINFVMEEDAVLLDNVVVSANRGETTRREASNIVNVLTPKLFENTNATCMAQGLNFQPGVRVENNCQNCGFTQVRINGLDGPYTQILIDSRPIFSALAGVYGLEQIPANMIERVEVVRGGGSALYGANAIAGTINIITKEPLNNSLTISNTTTLIGGTKTDVNTSVNGALVSENGKYGASLYGSTKQREGWDANGDGFTEIGMLRNHNLGFRSYFKTSLQSKLSIEYHNSYEFRRGGDSLSIPPHEANIAEQTEHNINTGGIKFDWFTRDYKHRLSVYASAQHVHRNSYYGTDKDPNAYGTTKDLTTVGGVQYIYSMEKCLFMPADLTVGAEVNYNTLHDETLAHNHDVQQDIFMYSAFAQNEWKNKTWTMLLGVRMDKHNLIKNPIFSPRVNFRYNPAEWVSLRTGYAMGFRAPQIFDEDLHITAVGGKSSIIHNAENLRPERSHSVNLSADFYKSFGQVQTNFLIDGFFTKLQDVFVLNEMPSTDESLLKYERQNGKGATVMGVSLEARVAPSNKWNIQLGGTIQQSQYDEAEWGWTEDEQAVLRRKTGKEMFRSPNSYGYLTVNYLPIRGLNIAASGTYTGRMWVQHCAGYIEHDEEVLTPAFFDLNLKVAYDIQLKGNTTLQVNAGVQNILNSFQKDFDEGSKRDGGYIYGPSTPRSYFAGLKFSL